MRHPVGGALNDQGVDVVISVFVLGLVEIVLVSLIFIVSLVSIVSLITIVLLVSLGLTSAFPYIL